MLPVLLTSLLQLHGVSKVPGVLAIHRVHIVAIAFGPDVVGVPAVVGSLILVVYLPQLKFMLLSAGGPVFAINLTLAEVLKN